MKENLTQTEIDFLRSLSTSDLSKVLGELPKEEAKATLRQLMDRSGDSRAGLRNASDSELARKNRLTRMSQDIHPLPPHVAGDIAELRSECDQSLKLHVKTCYPGAFSIKFSADHDKLIDQIQETVENGGLKALAMPRGSGKTTIIMRAALWSILTGHRKFAVIIAATDQFAQNLLKGIKTELISNEMIASLYGRETYALRMLEGEARKSSGQRYNGARTNVGWYANSIQFGFIPGVATSGAILSCTGITGNIRGQQVTGSDGIVRRPDIVLGDDLQTKESADSETQCEKRYEILMGDVLGMAGAKKSIAGLFSSTILRRGDMASRMLDRKQTPVMRGEVCKLVYKWPVNERKWDEYRSVWEEELGREGDGSEAAAFVRNNYQELHDGAVVGWQERFNSNEVSALQHAYNLRYRDELTFFAEFQNDPQAAIDKMPFVLNADEIVGRLNGVPRYAIPMGCEKITTFIDVQNNLLFFMQMAWEMSGRGHIINYGTFPDQERWIFSKANVSRTLEMEFGTDDLAESIYAGLANIVPMMFNRQYKREDGVILSLDRCGIDARSGHHTGIVRRFCREHPNRSRCHPQFGQFIGASSKPWQQLRHNKREEALGVHCKLKLPADGQKGVRELIVDVNWWKSFAAEKLTVGIGADNAILLHDGKPYEHQMFAEHCCAEQPVLAISKTGVEMIEWRQGNNSNNDYWDCLVGNCVLASMEGIKINVEKQITKRPRNKKPKNFVSLE